MADVPLGAMLSGGIDSSLIVALMARNMSEPVKTFSVGFAGAPEATSSPMRVSLRTRSAPIITSSSCRFADGASTSRISSGTSTSRSPISRRSDSTRSASSPREHVTVALSGQGADELFGGYDKHRAAALTGIWRSALGPAAPWRAASPLRGPTPVPAGGADARCARSAPIGSWQ